MCLCDPNVKGATCKNCAEKHPGGQPEKYYEGVAEDMIKYFDIVPGYDEFVENSKGMMCSVRVANDFPTLAGFAIKLGVGTSTLWDWAHRVYPKGHEKAGELRHPEFSEAYKRVSDFQQHILITNGLKNGYHANFAIFTAKNVIGWRDKQDVAVTGKDDGPIETKNTTTTINIEDLSDEAIKELSDKIVKGRGE